MGAGDCGKLHSYPVIFLYVPKIAPETRVQDKSRRDDRIQPGVLTPGISCIPPRKKSRRDAGKKLLQSYSTPSQKIITNYTFSSVAR